MKILYGIQGTGNGHISRGKFIYNLLKKYSKEIDVLVSGNNYSLKPNMPIKYFNKGITFAITNGKIDYLKTLANFDLYTSYLEQKEIPFKEYNLIITDFEPITAWSSVRYNIPSIHISHQASFIDPSVPRPKYKNLLGEYVMKYFCPTNDYIGLHYKSYGKNISEPVISQKLVNCVTELRDHITVYLSWYEDNELVNFFKKNPNIKFHIFSKKAKKTHSNHNCIIYPINSSQFFESMRTSLGVICNAGFQTTSEVLYLGKRLLVLPVSGQYEQFCNVAALNSYGVSSFNDLNDEAVQLIKEWIDFNPVKINFKNNLDYLISKKISEI